MVRSGIRFFIMAMFVSNIPSDRYIGPKGEWNLVEPGHTGRTDHYLYNGPYVWQAR